MAVLVFYWSVSAVARNEGSSLFRLCSRAVYAMRNIGLAALSMHRAYRVCVDMRHVKIQMKSLKLNWRVDKMGWITKDKSIAWPVHAWGDMIRLGRSWLRTPTITVKKVHQQNDNNSEYNTKNSTRTGSEANKRLLAFFPWHCLWSYKSYDAWPSSLHPLMLYCTLRWGYLS